MNRFICKCIHLIIVVASIASISSVGFCATKKFELPQADKPSSNVEADNLTTKKIEPIKNKESRLTKNLSEILSAISNDNDFLSSVDSSDVFGFDDSPFSERDPF